MSTPIRELAVQALYENRCVNKTAGQRFLELWKATAPDEVDGFVKAASIKAAQELMSKELHKVIDPVLEPSEHKLQEKKQTQRREHSDNKSGYSRAF